MTHVERPRCTLQDRWRRASAISIAAALSMALGLASPAGGQGMALHAHEPAMLSEIARDVLRRGAHGSALSAPEPSTPAAPREPEMIAIDDPADPVPPAAELMPTREAVTIPIAPGSSRGKKAAPQSQTGYESNSWRQRLPTGRALTFASGALAPASGLDPALRAHADGLRAEGEAFVYGFLLLRGQATEGVQRKLEALGVELLGRHDDHHKARLPLGSLQAIANLAEVEWVGVSAPEQKLSLDLSAARHAQAKTAAADLAGPIPIVINLFEGDDDGSFRQRLEAVGAQIGEYDADLMFYRAVAAGAVVEQIAALDFVLYVELIGLTSGAHDQSTPLIDADMIRPGTTHYGLTRYSGAPIPVGIMDSGFEMGAYGHDDLWKRGCGLNFTMEPGVFFDQLGHGTHVLGTIAGTGSADSRYRGVAPGVGIVPTGSIRAAKIWDKTNTGLDGWMESAMDWMALPGECDNQPAPLIVNISGGSSAPAGGYSGTDSRSRKLDYRVWINRQLYVVAAGNEGPAAQTVRTPGVAKNALTVGNVFDNGYPFVGDIWNRSSRGPTADGRMKPNVVAPGQLVTSAKADIESTSKYIENFGTSMAAPHVTGLAATLLEHYPSFQFNPALVRAHLMSTAIAHDGILGKSNAYGLGRVSGYVSHWDHPNNDGWSTYRTWGTISHHGTAYDAITVPVGTKRLAIALTWDEPPASAGASRAVLYDVDLWVDRDNDCTDPMGACGEYASVSTVDNVEYVVVNDPPAGTYRLKVVPSDVTGIVLNWGMTATIIRGDPEPAMTAYVTATDNPTVGSTFGVTVNVGTPEYVAAGVHVEILPLAVGITPSFFETKRLDGITMLYGDGVRPMTLGNVIPNLSRSATWYFKATTTGTKTFSIRVSSENGGEVNLSKSVTVLPAQSNADLVPMPMTMNPAAPVLAPGTTFSVTDTVQNVGSAKSGSSITRFYLSLDAMKSPDDTLLTGTHSVGGIDPGATKSGNVTLTIPATMPLNAYFLIACADDANAVGESDEANNCITTPGATVTVARPDLSATAVTLTPAAPVAAPGTAIKVSDTVRNLGQAASGSSTMRFYLSADPVKGAGDTLLIGSRTVPGLAGGASNSPTAPVTLRIPEATPLHTYYLLACADDPNAVTEGNEGNNCVATASAVVTVTLADLVATATSALPATKTRGTTFTVTDTVQNLGAVASGASATRHFLSLDPVKSTNDILLGSRSVPAVAPGAGHSRTITVKIPTATAPNAYYVLTCADATNVVVETSEANNCSASAATVTVTP